MYFEVAFLRLALNLLKSIVTPVVVFFFAIAVSGASGLSKSSGVLEFQEVVAYSAHLWMARPSCLLGLENRFVWA